MGNHLLRGGRSMAYTSRDGASHPESFWCFDGLKVDPSSTALVVTFRGWHDVAAYDADLPPIGGAEKKLCVSGDDYYDLIGRDAPGGTVAAAIIDMAWDAVSEDEFFSQATD